MSTVKLSTVIPAVFNQIKQGSTFLSVKNYINNYGEQSNFGIVFHINYITAVKKAVNMWLNYKPINAIESRARKDLIDSYSETLSGYNSRALTAHLYSHITAGESLIKGVKWLDNNKTIHLYGFLVHKVVLSIGEYPLDKSSEETIMRKRLMKMANLHRFRQFVIEEGRFSSIGVEGLTLDQRDLLRTIA